MLRARTRSHVDHLVPLLHATRAVHDAHEPGEVRRAICHGAACIVDGWGALLHLAGPGLLVPAARWGIHPDPARGELAVDGGVDRALRQGRVLVDDDRRMFLPVVGAAGVVGVVSIVGVRPTTVADVDALQIFGQVAGDALDRCGGEPTRATAALADLHPGDVVAVAGLRRRDLVDELGLHLRRAAWAGDLVARWSAEVHLLVLRQVREPVEVRVRRLVEPWYRTHPDARLAVGAALHLLHRAPLDTLDEATALHRRATELRGGATLLPSRITV